MGHELAMILMLLGLATPASAHLDNNVEYASVRIGIRLNFFPTLIVIPGYPVYYAPQLNTNFFFYDGMYWVYQDDYWYASSWYDGPWILVDPEVVPVFILRIPVRYYRRPPGYFYGWHRDSPPRWGEHWGHRWEQHRSGWDKWDRRSAPPLAPLPLYQQHYSGNRYPQLQQQQELQKQNYRYQPHDDVVRQHYQRQERAIPPTQPQGTSATPSSQPRPPVQQSPQPTATPQREQQTRQPQQQPRESRPQPVQTMPQTREMQRNAPVPQERPTPLPQPQKRDEGVRAPAQIQQTGPSVPRQQPQPRPEEFQHEQRQAKPPSAQKSSPQDRGSSQEPKRDQPQDQGKERVQEH